MALSKTTKLRIKSNQHRQKIMAWRRPILALFTLIQGSAKMLNNSQYGAIVNATVTKGLFYQSAGAEKLTMAILAPIASRKALINLVRETTHHTQAKATLLKLREFI